MACSHSHLIAEPPTKKILQPPASIVLMELSSKEPELMGMGMDTDLVMGNQISQYIAKNTQLQVASKFADGAHSNRSPDAKFGEANPEEEEEILACSGIALRRIQEMEHRVHGKLAKVDLTV